MGRYRMDCTGSGAGVETIAENESAAIGVMAALCVVVGG